jgi:hypothetical protein
MTIYPCSFFEKRTITPGRQVARVVLYSLGALVERYASIASLTIWLIPRPFTKPRSESAICFILVFIGVKWLALLHWSFYFR